MSSKEYYGHPKFQKYAKEMIKTHSKKSHDYADNNNPLSNFKTTSELISGIPDSPFKIAFSRVVEKILRICQVMKKGDCANESVIDSLMDLAVYSLLCRILLEENIVEKGYCSYREVNLCDGSHCDTCTVNK